MTFPQGSSTTNTPRRPTTRGRLWWQRQSEVARAPRHRRAGSRAGRTPPSRSPGRASTRVAPWREPHLHRRFRPRSCHPMLYRGSAGFRSRHTAATIRARGTFASSLTRPRSTESSRSRVSNLRFPKAVRAFHRLFRHAGDTREVRSARRNVVHPAMVGTGIRSRGGDERPTNDRGEGRWTVRGGRRERFPPPPPQHRHGHRRAGSRLAPPGRPHHRRRRSEVA